MTGYAQATSNTDYLSLVVTLRSVNHRFLDMQLHLPPQVEQFETSIRRHVQNYLKRGRLQLNVSLKLKQCSPEPMINHPLIDSYVETHHNLSKRYGFSQDPEVSAMLNMPGVLDFANNDLDEHSREKIQTALGKTLDLALKELRSSQELEAVTIVQEMRQCAESIKLDLEKLRSSLTNVIPQFRERLEKRLSDLFNGFQADTQRLIQEAALLSEKTDTSEEVHRLGVHIERLLELLENESTLGKRVDFLAQEMHRETNTILSKSNHLSSSAMEIIEIGLRLKSEIEKIREQAQNLA